MSKTLDALVEHVRVASFEAPQARSHAEWVGRIKSLFGECCAECGASEDDCAGEFHESGDASYQPLVFFWSHLSPSGDRELGDDG